MPIIHSLETKKGFFIFNQIYRFKTKYEIPRNVICDYSNAFMLYLCLGS